MKNQALSPDELAANIRERTPNIRPRIGIVLGSGLGEFADRLDNATRISYADLPGFPPVTVAGHQGVMVVGELFGVGVVCLQGRMHLYEGASHDIVKTYIRTLKRLGCEYFFAISASGSLCETVGPGQLMLIKDHINLQGTNPLIGPNDDDFGARFFPLDDVYDRETRETLVDLAEGIGVVLPEGVYAAVTGPNYETVAEIKALRMLGADAVGMSTVPEVLVATHCGMKVAVIAMITNFATGLASISHSHQAVVEMAAQSSDKVIVLLKQFIETLSK
ncbi:MAG: purine-nucleoside phosphorylase [Gammaproteobacteria bacterium]|nr:purine-nucleoside phosphorylase [Gammaproteobacteria bacterium]MCH9762777.1 purine-nucleoside phosphorylase [Gammaproteobacteria bacterium]